MKLCYIGWGYSIHNVKWLEWFAARGHEVHLITHRASLSFENVTVHSLSQQAATPPASRSPLSRKLRPLELGIRGLQFMRHVRKTVERIKPDLVHVQNGLAPNYLAAFLDYRPLLFSPWDGDVIWDVAPGKIPQYCVRRLIDKAELIIVNSELMKERCIERGAEATKVEVVRFPGVDADRFAGQKDNRELRNLLGLGESRLVLSARSLHFGIYNIDALIRAIPRVVQEVPAVKFLFTWPASPQLEETKALVEALGVQEYVILKGGMDYSMIPQYFGLADVFVSVSAQDSCPQSMLEAMAASIPVVMGDIPAVREWIQNGVNGYLVPPRDSAQLAERIIKTLQDKTLSQLFAQRNLDLVREKGEINKVMGRVEELYRQFG